MKIIYFNNCWFTNVGEAFIDLGGLEITKRIFGKDAQISCISAMTDYYINNAPIEKKHLFYKNVNKFTNFDMADYIKAEYVILPGMVGTIEFLNGQERKMIDKLVENGVKPIFLGLGGLYYDQEEIEEMKKYFDCIKPALITTRDNVVYEQYKNVAPCVKAIDNAFWTIDVFDPRGFAKKEYNVVAFNRINEPDCFKNMKNVVRPWHMQYSYRKENYKDTLMISDTPYDYLTIYANASKVYTDLVHATIVSLMYNIPVKFWENGTRFKAFYALEGLKNIEGFLFVSEEKLIVQKKKIVDMIKEIL